MAELMQKTKKELIVMLENSETALRSQQKDQQRLQNELEKALSENGRFQNEVMRIREAYGQLTVQYECLKKEHGVFEQRIQETARKSDVAYELFKSFVDTDSRKTILIDTSYTICYMNRSAAAHLQLPESGAVMGRRLFDFFAYKEAVKVKKKIDAAFFSGEKEKIKEVAFRNPKGAEIQIDLKLTRVRYRDKPSIKMIIK